MVFFGVSVCMLMILLVSVIVVSSGVLVICCVVFVGDVLYRIVLGCI